MITLTVIRFLTLLLGCCYTNVWSRIIIERLSVCSKDNSTPLYLNVTTKNSKQYLNVDITLRRALDESVGLTIDVTTTLDGKTYFPLCFIREKNYCRTLNTFLGEMWYDVERAAQMIPGACPIIAKRYYAHNHLIDASRMTIQNFPFGKIRFELNAIDNNSKTKKSLFCMLVEANNLQN